jgi:hypothetical protein
MLGLGFAENTLAHHHNVCKRQHLDEEGDGSQGLNQGIPSSPLPKAAGIC